MKKQIIDTVSEINIIYKVSENNLPKIRITTSREAFDILFQKYDQNTIAAQEQFIALYLNRYNMVIGSFEVSKGGVSATIVDMKILLGTALKVLASGIILSHNHPSGHLSPSKSDLCLTEKIKQGAELMDIKLYDHLIVSPEGAYYSMADEGKL